MGAVGDGAGVGARGAAHGDVESRVAHDDAAILRNAGRGQELGLCPYDFAAAVLIAQEAGCVVTDAYGGSLDDVLILDSSASNFQSIIGAANAELHSMLMKYFDAWIRHIESVREKMHQS